MECKETGLVFVTTGFTTTIVSEISEPGLTFSERQTEVIKVF